MRNSDDKLLNEIDIELKMEGDYEENTDESEQLSEVEKEKRRNEERARLLARLYSGDKKHLITRVAHILNEYTETRDSDITLQIRYWNLFEGFNPEEDKVSLEDLYKFERLTSITRARAKIQNEYRLFKANEEVRKWRRSKEEKEKEYQISTKPTIPTLHIYADESGKTQKYSLVGSLWIADQARNRKFHPHFMDWKKRKEQEGVQVPKEFHFTEMRRQQIGIYKEFVDEFM